VPTSDEKLFDRLHQARLAQDKADRFEDDEPTAVLEQGEAEESPTPPPALVEVGPGHVTRANLLRHPEAHPIILDLLLLERYGPEWLGWEPETLFLRVPQDFKSAISDLNATKLQAVKTLHLVDTYWQHWEVFLWLSMALNGIFPDFRALQVPSVGVLLVSVDIANRVRQDVDWTDEVKTFIETVLVHESFFTPIEPLSKVVTIHRDSELADWASIDARWPALKASKILPPDDTAENVQLRRMFDANSLLEESREQYHAQLPLVSRS